MERSDLHEYQNYCVDFLRSTPEAMLILEMGLGKSCISLTAILDLMFDSFEVSKVLVIAPLRVAKTVWPEERDMGACEVFADVCDDRERKAKRSGSEGTGRCVRDQPREREMAGYLP